MSLWFILKPDFGLPCAPAMKTSLLLLGAVLLGAIVPANAKVVTKTVEYSQGGQALQGYLAYDDSFKGKRPGVLVAHQWKGLSEYEMRRARMLAQMGYVAFALDIYGKGVRPKTPKKRARRPENSAPIARFCANAPVLPS